MKIALITSHAYPATKAGTEIYVHELAKSLLAYGASPVVITHDSLISEKTSLPYATKSISQGESLVKVISQLQTDVVHFHSLHEGGFSLFDLVEVREAGFAVLTTFHLANNTCLTNDLWKFREIQCNGIMDSVECASCYLQKKLQHKSLAVGIVKIQNTLSTLLDKHHSIPIKLTTQKIQKHHQLVRVALDKMNHIICLADWYKKVLLQNGVASEKISCIPQLRPKNDASMQKTSLPIKNILFIGRLEEEKGVYDILNAWKKAETNGLNLTLIGKISKPTFEKELSKTLRSLSEVTYLGALPHEQTLKEMTRHQVLILGSRFSEMSPLVIGEAISAGLALIGSDSPGVQEACQKGHFVTFKRGDIEELSAIFTALNDNALDFNEPKREFDGWTAGMMAKWHCEQYSRLMRKST